MNKKLKLTLASGIALAFSLNAASAIAQTAAPANPSASPANAAASSNMAYSVAVAQYDRAIEGSAAYIAAVKEVEGQFKAPIDAFNTRRQVLEAELNALVVKYQADQKTNPNNPALKAQETTIRNKQQAAQKELATLSQPFGKPLGYAREQIEVKLEEAIRNAMKAKNVGVIVNPESVIAVNPVADLTGEIINQINLLVKSVSTSPPANWQPGQAQREAAAAAPVPSRATPSNGQGR